MDITLDPRARNPQTGAFGFQLGADGDVSFDDTEAHAVLASALEDRGGYWADRAHGSDLFALQSITRQTPSQAEASIRQAEEPLVRANAIAGLDVTARSERASGRLVVDVSWTTPNGSTVTRTFKG